MSISKTKLNVLVNKNVKIAFWREKVRQKLHQRNFNPVKGSSERRKKLEHSGLRHHFSLSGFCFKVQMKHLMTVFYIFFSDVEVNSVQKVSLIMTL